MIPLLFAAKTRIRNAETSFGIRYRDSYMILLKEKKRRWLAALFLSGLPQNYFVSAVGVAPNSRRPIVRAARAAMGCIPAAAP